ncbi:MAG: hypothetical protein ACTSPY_04670 [Candidatus Helarchaeota archaeon]
MNKQLNKTKIIYTKTKEILRNQLIYELELGNKNLKKKIRHLHKGLKGFFLNPIIRTLYDWFIGPEIKNDMIRQINIMLDAAEILEGNENNQEFWEKWSKEYCNNDPWLKRCNKNHPIYPEVLDMFLDGFRGSVEEFNKCLQVEANDYTELAKKAFTKEELIENFEASLKLTKETMEKIINTKNLLKIPNWLKNDVIRIMKTGFEYAEKLAWDKIEKIYPN